MIWLFGVETVLNIGIIVISGLLPSGSDGRDSACNAGNPCSIPGLGWSPGEGNGNSEILENSD